MATFPSVENQQGIQYWRVPFFESIGCRAYFFLRQGGVSQGCFKSLNLGMNTSDDKQNVVSNREKLLKITHLGPSLPIACQQIHSNNIEVVNGHQKGRGWYSYGTAIPGTDALITATKGLPLCISTADCVPILLADEKQGGIAAIHAGWQGIYRKVISKSIHQMAKEKKITPSEIRAVVGPAIGPDCFEVTGEVLAKLKQLNASAVHKKPDSKRVYFNLWKAAFDQLVEAGIHPAKVQSIQDCTFSNMKRYFSYRRDGVQTGRMLAIVQMNKK